LVYLYLLLLGMEISLALAIMLEVIFIHFYEVATVTEDLIFVMLINVVTNPIVVAIASCLMSLTNLNKWIIQLPLEIIVVVIEWLFYKKNINNIRKPFRCALFANVISYFLPILITFILNVSFGLTTVFANPIMTPSDNVYTEQSQQCKSFEQYYIANGITGRYYLSKWICLSDPGNSALGISGIPKYILFDNDQAPPAIPEVPLIDSICVMGVALIEMSIGIYLIKVKLKDKTER